MMQGLCISCSISEVEQLRKNSSWGSTPETAGWISVISAQLLGKGDWNVRSFFFYAIFRIFQVVRLWSLGSSSYTFNFF